MDDWLRSWEVVEVKCRLLYFLPDEDDDDRKFERRKAKSMAKARNRCLPMNLGVEDVNKGILADRERIGSSLADVDPMNIDHSVSYSIVTSFYHNQYVAR